MLSIRTMTPPIGIPEAAHRLPSPLQ